MLHGESAEAPFQNLIAGHWVSPTSESGESQFNPSTGESTGHLPYAGRVDVDKAVLAAADAFADWKLRSATERADYLLKFSQQLKSNAAVLTDCVVREAGKTQREATEEVEHAITTVNSVRDAVLLRQDSRQERSDSSATLTRSPIGVAVGISLYNFPVAGPIGMFAPAIACGNTFVLRPCTWSPRSGMQIATLVESAGLPSGVVNLVHGSIDVVDQLLVHPLVRAVSYVGSGPWALYMYRKGADAGKRVQAHGATRCHIVVTEDADHEAAIRGIVTAAFGMSGQRWLAGTTVFLIDRKQDQFVERLARATEALKVGPASESGIEMGPVIRSERRGALAKTIADAMREGADLIVGAPEPTDSGGYFVRPTILDRVTTRMGLWQNEVLGPILSIVRVPDLDAAVAALNASPFGGPAVLYSSSEADAREFAERTDLGMIQVNDFYSAPPPSVPFPIWNGSYFGDLDLGGTDVLQFYSRQKVVLDRAGPRR